jgi:hypothetical protein
MVYNIKRMLSQRERRIWDICRVDAKAAGHFNAQLPRRKMLENAREQNGAMVFAALSAN